jgi:site-specific DNA recombinase
LEHHTLIQSHEQRDTWTKERKEASIKQEDIKTQEMDDAAAIYVRVSSTGQLGRDGDDDGYSIPAQVAACERKAGELGVGVARAYVERAESARSDDRPVLQQMLGELPALGVRYLIVHKVDRLARNRLDDAMLYQRLLDHGVTLVSASENIDSTPSGRLMHGMLATFAEYYSNNLATEVLKGLTQKARNGGTPMRAPLGYLNVRRITEGREVRTVTVDPDRAPLIRLAFDLYATGDWSVVGLTDYLNGLGLRTRPTPSKPSKELAPSQVYSMLGNRYYLGQITWNGAVYEGRHDPLIDPDTFERVQSVLAAHAQSGEHRMKRHHYLKGTLFCAHCGGRMVYGLSRGRNGTRYEYFFCISRAKRTGCPNRTNVRAEVLEEAVERDYVDLERRIQAHDIEATKGALRSRFGELRKTLESAGAQQRRRIATLKDKRRELLDLKYEGAIALDLFKEEQARLTREIAVAEQILDAISGEFRQAEELLLQALSIGAEVATLYRDAAGDPELRRLLNQIFFTRIEVEADGFTRPQVAQPIADMRDGTIVNRVKAAITTLVKALQAPNPGHLFDGQGSNLTQMVGAAGFEPATSRV